MDEARRAGAARTVRAALRDGKSVRECIGAGDVQVQMVDAVASIEITEKKYLLYKTAKQTTTLIKKDNYRRTLTAIVDTCGAADPKKAKGLSKKFRRIEAAVSYLNQTYF